MNLSAYLDIDSLFYRLIAFVVATALHDAVQAVIAASLGDRTAAERGRLSLNPLSHIHPLGLAMTIFGPYGWNQPVPVAPERMGRAGRLKAMLVYASGPALHLLLAALFWRFYLDAPGAAGNGAAAVASGWAQNMLNGFLHYFYIVNALLFILNLIVPFYPTDLWKALRAVFLEPRLPAVGKYEWLGLLVVIPILVLPIGQMWLAYLLSWCSGHVMNLLS